MHYIERKLASTQPLGPASGDDIALEDVAVHDEVEALFRPPQTATGAFACLIRPSDTVALAMPALCGLALGRWASSEFDLVAFFFMFIGVLSTITGLNLLGEYYDFRRTNDMEEAFAGESCFSTFCLMAYGLFPAKAIRLIAWLALLVGLLCMSLLAVSVGWPVLFFHGLFLLLGLTAFLPPFKLAYRGWGIGELSVLLAYGPILVLNGFYVQAKAISWLPMWAGLPLGLLALTVVYNFNLVYFRRDWLNRKRTLAVQLGPIRSVDLSAFLALVSYVVVVLVVSLSQLPLWALATLGGMPLALGNFGAIRRDYINSEDYYTLYRASSSATILAGLLFIIALTVDTLIR
ncbi:MAG: prenyltransferase [Caldilineaceae bacterium]|nr:prenyltransferase [Caldilineaceae bacterium]